MRGGCVIDTHTPDTPPGAGFQANAVTAPDLEVFGALAFLASFCPLHRTWTAARLQGIFAPPAALRFVRIFKNTSGTPCAALLWARLSDDVAAGLARDSRPIRPEDWNSGPNLWFMDILAPFGHGKEVARAIARNPPPEKFHFARVDADGKVRKVVAGDPVTAEVSVVAPAKFGGG